MTYPNVEIESERMFNKDVEEYLNTMKLLKEKYPIYLIYNPFKIKVLFLYLFIDFHI